MATKSYPAKILCSKADLEYLQRTHRLFNAGARFMTDVYLAMKNGRHGEIAVEIAKYLLEHKEKAHGLMYPLTDAEATDQLDNDGMKLVRQHRQDKGILFSRHECIFEFESRKVHASSGGKKELSRDAIVINSKFWQGICNQAMEHLRSNNALMQDWRTQRQKWLEEKEKFFQENEGLREFIEGYAARFDEHTENMRQESQAKAGQEVHVRKKGKSSRGKRWGGWHLWYEWICQHREIIEWRGKAKAEDFVFLTPEEVQEVEKRFPKRQDRRSKEMLKLLAEKNPELKEVENLRRKYVNQFMLFKRPPTLTLPSAEKHPRWYQMEKDELYRSVDFNKGTIELYVTCYDETEDVYYMDWRTFRVKPDPRLEPRYRDETFAAEGRYPPYKEGKVGNTLNRPADIAAHRLAGLKGAKLILKRGSNAQLMFTVVEQDAPLKSKFSKKTKRTSSADNLDILDGREAARVMAVDLGARHAGAYAIVEGKKEGDSWKLEYLYKNFIASPELPDLRSIVQHERQLREGRRKRGKPVSADKRSFVSLQDHRTDMSMDRFKKAANMVVEKAREHDVHVIVFEALDDLKPTAYNERWLNRQIRNMNHRHIFDLAKQMAPEFGINVTDAKPYNTSRLCSKCGFPGYRFSIKRKEPYKEQSPRSGCKDFGYPIWDTGGHLFRCPHCGYRVQADINAAGNIARKFFGQLIKWDCKDYRYSNGTHPVFDARKDFDDWAAGVRRRKAMPDAPF